MKKPSEKQANLLESMGIRVPRSIHVARRLISYVLDGNGTGGNQTIRIGYAKHFNADWIGKRVKVDKGSREGRTGTVKEVMSRSLKEVLNIKQQNPNIKSVSPFVVSVKWDDEQYRACYCPPVELVIVDS